MNRHGQVLVLFVLLLPILLAIFAYIFDNTYIAYNVSHLNSINELVINDANVMNLSTMEIEEYINKNDETIHINSVELKDNKLEIIISKDINSYFGKIIGKNSYHIVSKKTITLTKKEAQ